MGPNVEFQIEGVGPELTSVFIQSRASEFPLELAEGA
jgi:hypothetical protein